jgi:hypothetical protein
MKTVKNLNDVPDPGSGKRIIPDPVMLIIALIIPNPHHEQILARNLVSCDVQCETGLTSRYLTTKGEKKKGKLGPVSSC